MRAAYNVVERLRAHGYLAAALADLLGLDRSAKSGEAIRCIFPGNHEHGDRTPSMRIRRNLSGVDCYGAACGFRSGLLDLGVAVGRFRSRADVARYLDERYLGVLR